MKEEEIRKTINELIDIGLIEKHPEKDYYGLSDKFYNGIKKHSIELCDETSDIKELFNISIVALITKYLGKKTGISETDIFRYYRVIIPIFENDLINLPEDLKKETGLEISEV